MRNHRKETIANWKKYGVVCDDYDKLYDLHKQGELSVYDRISYGDDEWRLVIIGLDDSYARGIHQKYVLGYPLDGIEELGHGSLGSFRIRTYFPGFNFDKIDEAIWYPSRRHHIPEGSKKDGGEFRKYRDILRKAGFWRGPTMADKREIKEWMTLYGLKRIQLA